MKEIQVYDINPNPRGTGLSLNISETDNSLSLDLCREVAALFRWNKKEANDFLQKSQNVVSDWDLRARQLGISSTERILMTTAFLP